MIQSVEAYDQLEEMAEALMPFYNKLPFEGKKKPEDVVNSFASRWSDLISQGFGKIFGLWEDDKIIGGIGVVNCPALEDGAPITQEAFWYIDEKKRGSGVRLFKAAEDYANSVGSERFVMVHLENSMPQKIKKFYERLGFTKIETGYIKEL